jgi:hypothetical protein
LQWPVASFLAGASYGDALFRRGASVLRFFGLDHNDAGTLASAFTEIHKAAQRFKWSRDCSILARA